MVCSFAFKVAITYHRLFFPLNSVVSRERLGEAGGRKSVITLLIVFTDTLGRKFPPKFVNLIALPLYQVFTWEYLQRCFCASGGLILEQVLTESTCLPLSAGGQDILR